MIRDKYLQRHIWEAKLRRWGCKPLEGKGRLNTAEWWIGKIGPFTVPIEADGTCEHWAIRHICEAHGLPPSECNDEPTQH